MPSPKQKLIYLFNWPLVITLLFLLLVGLVNLYSATASGPGDLSPFFRSQLIWTGLGLLILMTALSFHYRRLLDWAGIFYGICIFLLLAVLFFGTTVGGQKNWLVLGPIRLQPSELTKLGVILMLARYYSKLPEGESRHLRSIWKPLGILGLPLLLILVERDLGSAIFFVLIGFSFFFFTGLQKRFLATGLILMTLAGLTGYQFFLKDYQRARIQTFLHPEQDAQGRGYHLMQSKIAVGSGQGLGKGYLKGNLNKLKFLPERHTDFVFPVLAEEWGFLGSLIFLSAFSLFLFLLLQTAGKVGDPFGALIIVGITAWLFWQWVFNMGGVLGLVPLAGVTMPFLSYGGSALLTNLLALGLVLNVSMRRYVF
ncbi:MAG: rod shape-determining protein RodA [bacterium]|nr:rod shape-determining protein RodA [bacterium]